MNEYKKELLQSRRDAWVGDRIHAIEKQQKELRVALINSLIDLRPKFQLEIIPGLLVCDGVLSTKEKRIVSQLQDIFYEIAELRP